MGYAETILDYTQVTLDVIGLSPDPFVGMPADAINGIISRARGNYLEMNISFAAMLGADALKGLKYADEAVAGAKYLDEAVEAAEVASKKLDDLTPMTQGTSRPLKNSTPNSIYEQFDSSGNIQSRAFYDGNGNQFSRQDYGHNHYDKSTKQSYKPHEHLYDYNNSGQPIGSSTRQLPYGY